MSDGDDDVGKERAGEVIHVQWYNSNNKFYRNRIQEVQYDTVSYFRRQYIVYCTGTGSYFYEIN